MNLLKTLFARTQPDLDIAQVTRTTTRTWTTTYKVLDYQRETWRDRGRPNEMAVRLRQGDRVSGVVWVSDGYVAKLGLDEVDRLLSQFLQTDQDSL